MKKCSTGTENKVRCYFGVTSPAVHRNNSKFITASSLSKLHDDTTIVAAKELMEMSHHVLLVPI